MLDRYSVEKLIDAHRADAVKRAAQERLAAAAAAGGPNFRRGWLLVARLRALASSSVRAALPSAAQQREG